MLYNSCVVVLTPQLGLLILLRLFNNGWSFAMYKFKFPFLLVVLAMTVSIQVPQAEVTPAVRREVTLTASTDHLIQDVTQNLSLKCAYNKDLDSNQSSLAEISRIRMLKADDSDQWKLVAEVKDNEVKVYLYDNIVGSGQVIGHSAYLNLTWPTVEVTTFGRYRCDIPGFDRNLDYAVEKSNVVTMTEQDITAKDVRDLLLAERNRYQHKLDTAMKTVNLLIEEKLKTMNMSINEKIEKINNATEEELDKDMETMKLSIDEKLKTTGYKYEPWPEGTYSLLAPVTGCPHSSEWRKGYFKIHTQILRTQNSNFVPKLSNLPPYTRFSEGGKNFMILMYCSKIISTPGIPWPSGSYCINKRGSCPTGFHSGYIHAEVAYAPVDSNQGGYHPDSNLYSYHFYCCRSDGPANRAIILPTADPFYLYRFKGRCQHVANMHLHVESVQIDTIALDNRDSYARYHPDGRINPVVLELCHYRPLSYILFSPQ